MQYASDAIFIADKNGKFLEANTKACEITQRTREELLQLGPADIIPTLLQMAEIMKPRRILK